MSPTPSAGAAPAASSEPAPEPVPAVGLRQPCPCGSGRRYKACHGRGAGRAAAVHVARPFAGLAGECDWVALRELVPAATAPLRLPDGRTPVLATILPLGWAAMARADGEVLVALQGPPASGDLSREMAAAMLQALAAEPGTSLSVPVAPAGAAGPGPRLQDLLDVGAPLEVRVHAGFDFWLPSRGAGAAPDGEVTAALERANAAATPTARLHSVEAAYWGRVRDRAWLRWVLPHDEEPLLDAMARLRAAGADGMGEGSRFVGSFRACGLVVPVWDLAPGTPHEQVEEPAARYGDRLGEALATGAPLTADERRARAGLLSRQLTLR